MNAFADHLSETLFLFDPEGALDSNGKPARALFILPLQSFDLSEKMDEKPSALFTVAEGKTFLGRVMGWTSADQFQVIPEIVLLPSGIETLTLIDVRDQAVDGNKVQLDLVQTVSDGRLDALFALEKDAESIPERLPEPLQGADEGSLVTRLRSALDAYDDSDITGRLTGVACLRARNENTIEITAIEQLSRDLREASRSSAKSDSESSRHTIKIAVRTGPDETYRDTRPGFLGVRSVRRPAYVTLASTEAAFVSEHSESELDALARKYAEISIWTDIHILQARRVLAAIPEPNNDDILAHNPRGVYGTRSTRSLLSRLRGVRRVLAVLIKRRAQHRGDINDALEALIGEGLGAEIGKDALNSALPLNDFKALFKDARDLARRRRAGMVVRWRGEGLPIPTLQQYDDLVIMRFLQILAKKARTFHHEGEREKYNECLGIATQLIREALNGIDHETRVGLDTVELPMSILDQIHVQRLLPRAENDQDEQNQPAQEKAEKPADANFDVKIYDGISDKPQESGFFVMSGLGLQPLSLFDQSGPPHDNLLNFLFAEARKVLQSRWAAKVQIDGVSPSTQTVVPTTNASNAWYSGVVHPRNAFLRNPFDYYDFPNIAINQRLRISTDPERPPGNDFWNVDRRSLGVSPEDPLFWSAKELVSDGEDRREHSAPKIAGAELRLPTVLRAENLNEGQKFLKLWADHGFPFETMDASDAQQIHLDWFNNASESSREWKSKLLEHLRDNPQSVQDSAHLLNFDDYTSVAAYISSTTDKRPANFDSIMTANPNLSASETLESLAKFMSAMINDIKVIRDVEQRTPDWIPELGYLPRLREWSPPQQGFGVELSDEIWLKIDPHFAARLRLLALAHHLNAHADDIHDSQDAAELRTLAYAFSVPEGDESQLLDENAVRALKDQNDLTDFLDSKDRYHAASRIRALQLVAGTWTGDDDLPLASSVLSELHSVFLQKNESESKRIVRLLRTLARANSDKTPQEIWAKMY